MAAEKGGDNADGLRGMVHGVRSLGSATLDLAYTAMGSLDIWWEGGCWEWFVFFFLFVPGDFTNHFLNSLGMLLLALRFY